MAVIGKIRERSTLLLIVVGGALMAFVLTDLFSSRGSVFGGDLDSIGTVDGVSIKGIDFNARYEREIENYKNREKTSDIPEIVQGQIRDQVWEQYLNELLLIKDIDKLGIAVGVEELGDMAYGDNPHPQVRQAFTNPQTGQFNKSDVINFLKNLERDETGKTKNQWLLFEKAMKEERKINKYYTMIRKGLYTTDQEAEDYHKAQNKRMDVSFIVKRYADIPDSAVVVDESDLKDYYNENSYKYKEKKSRKIEYAIFEVRPSTLDSAAIKQWVDKTYEEFKLTTDDSTFVNANSDREFDFRFYSRNDENERIDTALYLQDKAGYMEEPVIDNESWKMVKISKMKFAPDSVEARHILLSFTKTNKDEIKSRIDSIKMAIENGADFAEMAEKYTVDPGSKKEGGDLGWFKEGYMIPVINDSCFHTALNRLMVIESSFGMHLVEVTAKSEVVKKLQVAIIYRSIDASRETVDREFTASNDFSIQLGADVDMPELAHKFNVRYNSVDVKESENMVPEIESSRGLIRWAYNAEIGQVSEALQFGSTFVVARLLEIHEDGIAPLESVRSEVEIGATKDKKALKFIEEMNGFTDLESASENLSLKIDKANGVIFESFSVPVMGREPNVLGKMFTMEEGDLSVPIKGFSGVFIVRIDKVEDALPNDDYSVTKYQMSQNRTSRVNYEVFEALKDRVEIVDNRFRVY